jgi:hypothetical protein
MSGLVDVKGGTRKAGHAFVYAQKYRRSTRSKNSAKRDFVVASVGLAARTQASASFSELCNGPKMPDVKSEKERKYFRSAEG